MPLPISYLRRALFDFLPLIGLLGPRGGRGLFDFFGPRVGRGALEIELATGRGRFIDLRLDPSLFLRPLVNRLFLTAVLFLLAGSRRRMRLSLSLRGILLRATLMCLIRPLTFFLTIVGRVVRLLEGDLTMLDATGGLRRLFMRLIRLFNLCRWVIYLPFLFLRIRRALAARTFLARLFLGA